MDGSFLVRLVYDDDITYNIVEAAERVLSKFLIDFPVYIEAIYTVFLEWNIIIFSLTKLRITIFFRNSRQ